MEDDKGVVGSFACRLLRAHECGRILCVGGESDCGLKDIANEKDWWLD